MWEASATPISVCAVQLVLLSVFPLIIHHICNAVINSARRTRKTSSSTTAPPPESYYHSEAAVVAPSELEIADGKAAGRDDSLQKPAQLAAIEMEVGHRRRLAGDVQGHDALWAAV